MCGGGRRGQGIYYCSDGLVVTEFKFIQHELVCRMSIPAGTGGAEVDLWQDLHGGLDCDHMKLHIVRELQTDTGRDTCKITTWAVLFHHRWFKNK